MKIVYCIPSLHNSGGMERVLSQKANYFAENFDYEVHIVTSSQKNRTPFYPLSTKVMVHDISVDYEEMLTMPLIKRISKRIQAKKVHKKKLEAFLKDIKPDITVSMFTHEMSFLPKINDGSKKILELHFSKNFRILDAKSNGRSAILKNFNKILDFFDRKSIKKYDRFVVLTHKDASDWGDNNRNIEVIPNPTAFSVKERIPDNNKKVLAVGRHCPQKGFDLLVDIWNALPVNLKNDWYLDIVGNGPCKDELQCKIDNLGLSKSISLIPQTNDIEKEYLNHRIFCFPSRYEGFPLALMEAMSFSIPPVAFDCPCGPADMIINGQNGFLIEPGNIGDFTEKLRYLMENDSLYSHMALAASSHIKSNFSEDKVMKKWQDLFETIL